MNLFYSQIALQKGLPFKVRLPNKKTLAAMQDVETKTGKTFKNIDDLFEDLENEHYSILKLFRTTAFKKDFKKAEKILVRACSASTNNTHFVEKRHAVSPIEININHLTNLSINYRIQKNNVLIIPSVPHVLLVPLNPHTTNSSL